MPGFIRHATQATGTDAGNGDIRKAQWNADHVLDGVPYVLAQSGTAVSVGAVTTETVLATITVPAGAMGPNGWIQVIATVTINNNANNKTFSIRAGGTGGTLYYNGGFNTQLFGSVFKHICNANSQTSQKGTSPGGGNLGVPGAAAFAIQTSTVNTAAAWDLVISGQKAVAGDTITLETYQVLVCYGA
jgi:hypothetical protein